MAICLGFEIAQDGDCLVRSMTACGIINLHVQLAVQLTKHCRDKFTVMQDSCGELLSYQMHN